MEIVCGVQEVYCQDSKVFWGHREFIYEKKEKKNCGNSTTQKKLIESTIKKEKSFPCTKKKHIEFLLQRSVNLSESNVENFTIIVEVANGGN